MLLTVSSVFCTGLSVSLHTQTLCQLLVCFWK